ncbi:MAG: hypothetical protein A4E34_00618 [Methanoregula sp. PtaU1.Bin006]|nr:MAG: hypothetical protein A4E33_02439 [Methanoregula sp. PtaB.Bin085]OPY35618.1 MAG: hypothetical protein A4E34_00618 [Methanoregula sp. PtaU1.Bin006]
MMGKRENVLFFSVSLIIGLLVLAVPVQAADITIVPNDPVQGSIRGAIINASSGDRIILGAGTYNEHDILIDKDITVRSRSGSAADTIIDAMRAGRIFVNSAGYALTIDSLTLQNATMMNVDFGGAVFNDNGGTLTITSSRFFNCSANVGGAIFNNHGGTVTITGSAFTDCSSWFGGAITNYWESPGTVTITSSEFLRCTVSPDPFDYEAEGGAIGNMGTLVVTSSTFTDCSAQAATYLSAGGAIYNYQGTATITSSVFTNCHSGAATYHYWGGAIQNVGGTLTVTSSEFNGCSAPGGGAIHVTGGSAAIAGSTFTGCSAEEGGAIYSEAPLTITGSTFSGCTATGRGGAIRTTSTLSITNSIISGCSADTGGAILSNGGTVDVISSTISGCTAADSGGAIGSNGAAISITSSTISGCTATDSGGAIDATGGTILITGSDFTGCSTGMDGGAIAIDTTCAVTAADTTFTGCLATVGNGGAIFNGGGTATVTRSTFTGCSAGNVGGAIYNTWGGTAAVHYSHIYQNTAAGAPGFYCSGSSVFSAENNWWGTNAGPAAFISGPVAADPWLVLGITADPASIDTAGTSAIRTNLTFNSDDLPPGGGYVPDAISNTYAMISGSGSVSPLTDWTVNGVAETTFTPVYGETVNISGTVDGQTVYIDLPVAQGAPAITGITPNTGVNSTGIAITNLAGSSFTIHGTTVVRLMRAGHTNITATGVTIVSPSQINCTLPIAGAEAGAWDVVVINPDEREAVLPGAFTVTPAAPVISGITPNTGLNVSAIAITNLAGSGFLSGPAVRLVRAGHTNITAIGVTVVSPLQITCILPITGAEAGAWDVVMINMDGQEAVLPGGFTVTVPVPVPTPLPTYSQQDTGETLGDFPNSPTNPLMTVTVNIGGDSKAWQAVVTGTNLRDLIVTGTEQYGPFGSCNPPAGSVFQYLGLEPARYGTITNTVINFTVPQAWLDANNIAPGNIVLYHMTQDCWQALPTTFLEAKDGTVYYSAQSNGFSSFAIAGTPGEMTPAIAVTTSQPGIAEAAQPPAPAAVAKVPVTTQTTTPPAPAQAPAKSSPFPLVPVVAVIGCIGLIGGGWYVRRSWIRRQNPALFEES